MDWIAFAFLLIVASGDLFIMLFFVPKIRGIYTDMLGNRPLPSCTSFVLQGRYLFEALGFAYIGGGILVVRLASSRIALRSILVLISAATLQAGFTFCALIMPLMGDIQGVNSPSPELSAPLK